MKSIKVKEKGNFIEFLPKIVRRISTQIFEKFCMNCRSSVSSTAVLESGDPGSSSLEGEVFFQTRAPPGII